MLADFYRVNPLHHLTTGPQEGLGHDGQPADGGGSQEDGGEQAPDGGGPVSHRLLHRVSPVPRDDRPGGGGGARGDVQALPHQEHQERIQEVFSSPGANT